MVINSIVPVGYTWRIREELNCEWLMFSPEFLRKGGVSFDWINPSRINVGSRSERAWISVNLLAEGVVKSNIDILFTNSTEAEVVKLFSNTYLTMRVRYFNELESCTEIHGLNAKQSIECMRLDPITGDHCLPKGTKQLLVNFDDSDDNVARYYRSQYQTKSPYYGLGS